MSDSAARFSGIRVSAILTPWYRRTAARLGSGPLEAGSVSPTGILDHESPAIQALVRRATQAASANGTTPAAIDVLEAAHAIISSEVKAVYAMEETTPASRTFARGSGSCSQRLAILESVARAIGVRTRVRALLIDRAFWYPRFPRLKAFLPNPVLLLWPEFGLGEWVPASELFGTIGCRGGGSFNNNGAETLFEAVGRCAVAWDGKAHESAFDLSHFVLRDHGYFTNRDGALQALGQTLCTPARALINPVLSRVRA